MSEFQNGSYKKKKILKHETLYGNDDGYGNCNTQVMIFFLSHDVILENEQKVVRKHTCYKTPQIRIRIVVRRK